jgi:DNA-binding phage protein
VKHSERTQFDYERFIEDIKTYYKTLPRINTDLTMVGRIARETGIDKMVLKYAFSTTQIRSFDTILRLAGWAGLYLDEYRRE